MTNNTPYLYIHTYKCLLENAHGEFWIDYPMHCDRPSSRDRKNIIELRNRLSIFFRQYRIVKINPKKSKRNG